MQPYITLTHPEPSTAVDDFHNLLLEPGPPKTPVVPDEGLLNQAVGLSLCHFSDGGFLIKCSRVDQHIPPSLASHYAGASVFSLANEDAPIAFFVALPL